MTDAPNLERLKKMLALAISTDKESEAIAALRMMRQHLHRHGKDQHWFTDQIGQGHALPFVFGRAPERQYQGDVPWEDMLAHCAMAEDMRYRDIEFIDSLLRQNNRWRNWEPTERQLSWLRAIYQRTRP